jgi:myo-inositol-1(or 4)-monophosphatase
VITLAGSKPARILFKDGFMPEPDLSEIIEWARGAGEILRSGYGKHHQISQKGRIDLVTEYDRKSEDYLIARIREKFSDHKIYSEESGELKGNNNAVWYIDPLDGTTNYAHNLPVFCVSIAFAEAGKLVYGVIYDPMRDECFSAAAACGARRNGEKIHVTQTRELVQSLLLTGFAYDMETIEGNLIKFAHFSRLTQGVRRMGSAALDLCNVAAGRVDGYWEQTLQPYDMAAGSLIVREAGGVVTDLTGNPHILKPPYAVVAANPFLHPLMVAEFLKIH